MSKPRRRYNSPAAVIAHLQRIFDGIWKNYINAPDPPRTLYHYCPDCVLPKILSSRSLRASDVLRMNDPNEVTYALSEIIGPIARQTGKGGLPKYFIKSVKSPDIIKTVFSGWCTHIACFSSTAELPSQWADYAKCTGYAIGFNRAALAKWCDKRGISLFPMNYERSRHEEMIRQFLDGERQVELNRIVSGKTTARDELRDKAYTYLSSLALTMKAICWHREKEWRILVIEPADGNRFQRLMRDDGVGFFELPICMPEIVTDVILGPRCISTKQEVQQWLSDAGLSSVSVRQSLCQCPESNE